MGLAHSLARSQTRPGKVEPEKVEPALVLSYLQGKLEEQIEDLFEFHFSGTRQSPLLFSPAVSETQRGEERHPPPQKTDSPDQDGAKRYFAGR